jgi:dihydrofolate synthase/folylpolyglutamate synthase
MPFDKAIDYITDALKFGINPGLDKIEAVCAELGNPQLKYPTIQITGTNGKTSTTWMTRQILSESGLKVGCYTSPHLHTYRERITVDGEMISEQEFAATLEAIKPALEKTKRRFGDLTEFEILTAMAIQYFAEVGVDVAVFEVGLGGRWDATSVVRPKVAVITGISLDHTDRLGETVEEIAWDKAHIIKEGCVAVLGNMPDGALKTVLERCESIGADVLQRSKDFEVRDAQIIKNEGSQFSVNGIYASYEDIELQVFGDYQVNNFATALAACEAFSGMAIASDVLEQAAKTVKCPGRFELISRNPTIILDGAHNPEGMRMVAEGLPKAFSYNNLHFVLAISSDKDIEQMIDILMASGATLVLSTNSSYRSASVETLADVAIRSGNSYSIEPDLRNAIERAVSIAAADDLVCITGSLYTVADARSVLLAERAFS